MQLMVHQAEKLLALLKLTDTSTHIPGRAQKLWKRKKNMKEKEAGVQDQGMRVITLSNTVTHNCQHMITATRVNRGDIHRCIQHRKVIKLAGSTCSSY